VFALPIEIATDGPIRFCDRLRLFMPHGVAFHDGALYVAEFRRVIRFDGTEQRLEPAGPVVVSTAFRTTHHGARPLPRPGCALYVGIGACNSVAIDSLLHHRADRARDRPG
jgi:glucose/arabinose dehydrogenase